MSSRSTPSRSSLIPKIVIVAGLVVATAHLILGLTGNMTAMQWISGVIIGLLIAGGGNHFRIHGRRA